MNSRLRAASASFFGVARLEASAPRLALPELYKTCSWRASLNLQFYIYLCFTLLTLSATRLGGVGSQVRILSPRQRLKALRIIRFPVLFLCLFDFRCFYFTPMVELFETS